MELSEIIETINTNLKRGLIPTGEDAPSDHIVISQDDWAELASFLRTEKTLLFDSLMCLTGFDEGAEEQNLGVIYNLHSMTFRHKLEVRIVVPKSNPSVPSVEQVWRLADWFEREVFDMFGIVFEGHRDLRRILLPEDWEGYPLRKDYNYPESWHGIIIPKMKEGWE